MLFQKHSQNDVKMYRYECLQMCSQCCEEGCLPHREYGAGGQLAREMGCVHCGNLIDKLFLSHVCVHTYTHTQVCLAVLLIIAWVSGQTKGGIGCALF